MNYKFVPHCKYINGILDITDLHVVGIIFDDAPELKDCTKAIIKKIKSKQYVVIILEDNNYVNLLPGTSVANLVNEILTTVKEVHVFDDANKFKKWML